MRPPRWTLAALAVALAPACGGLHAQQAAPGPPELLLRYEYQGRFAYGRVERGVVHELPGADLFTAAVNAPTGRRYPLESVRPLQPLEPELVEKVLAVSDNTRRPGRMGPVPHPRWHALFPSSLSGHEAEVEVPAEARNFSYAGGLVVIVGRQGRHIPEGEAARYVWGVTVGSQFSEAGWFAERRGSAEPGRIPAAAGDGWAPTGPFVARNLDYGNLRVETRLNGEVVQSGRTSDLVNGIPSLIAHISRYVTLKPGDLIFVGTVPYREGARRTLAAGDVVEVEIQGIGTLRNRIVPMPTTPGGRP